MRPVITFKIAASYKTDKHQIFKEKIQLNNTHTIKIYRLDRKINNTKISDTE